MTKRVIVAIVMLLSFVLLAFAQGRLPRIVADIPFSFMAGQKTLPAGNYLFKEGNTPRQIVIRNTKTNEEVMLTIVSRTGKRVATDIEIVFDKTGDNHTLAEIQMPGAEGYMFKGASDKHEHVTIKAKP